ncbi:MAG: Hpt domain-containing protein, partial [Lachnospiraceae bacterium]|nr:Hpt domain-containing protein [Lachnospiraceae bacterium]
MDVSQYLEIFLDETNEHLQNLNTQILELEQDPENSDTVNEIFRAAHSLKGMAGTMGYKRMQNLTHDMENVFSEVRNGNIKVQPEMIDVLFQCLDALQEYTDNIKNTADEGTNDNEPLIRQLNDILNNKGATSEAAAPAQAAPAAEKAEESSSDEPWYDINYDESQISVLSEAAKQGRKVYGINVTVDPSCVLKAARAFLVVKAIEEKGELIVSNPNSQDLEDEKFENDFTLIVISDEPLENLIAAAKSVSEISDAVGKELDVTKLHSAEAEGEAEEAPAAQTTAPAVSEAPKAAPASAPAQGAAPAKAADKKPGKVAVKQTVRVDIEKLDSLMNLVSELITAKNSLVSASSSSEGNNSSFNEQIEYLESVTSNLHESVMKVRMVPIESTVNKFPRMIRDLQKQLGKKLDFYMSGEETELDRTVVDQIGDPIMHLLRNSADHGIESAEIRAQRGKPEAGSIWLDAYQDGNNV